MVAPEPPQLVKAKATRRAQRAVAEAPSILSKPNHSARARITEYILYKSQGLSNTDIAAKLGIQRTTLNTIICKATRDGWLKLEDPEERLEIEIKPLIVDNVKEFLLDRENDAARLKMTVESAKGVGIFKAHQAVKVEGMASNMVLALKFETPEHGNQMVEGHIIGTPKLPMKVSET